MKPRLVATLQDTSTENDASTTRSRWPRNARQGLLDMNASETRQLSPFIYMPTDMEKADTYAIVLDRVIDNLHSSKSEDSVGDPIRHIQEAINQWHYSDTWAEQVRANVLSSIMMHVAEAGRTAEAAYKWNERDIDRPEASIAASRSRILADIRTLFRNAAYEVFEDGMNSYFGSNLTRIIQAHGFAAVEEIEKLIHADGANTEVAAEALICTGRVNDDNTRRARLAVLERALESDNVCIRDAASVAIEFMDDPAAIDSIKKAIAKEECKPLRQNLRDVLVQLQDAT